MHKGSRKERQRERERERERAREAGREGGKEGGRVFGTLTEVPALYQPSADSDLPLVLGRWYTGTSLPNACMSMCVSGS